MKKKSTKQAWIGRPPKKKLGRPFKTTPEIPVKENGLELLTIETGVPVAGRIKTLDHYPDYVKLKALIETMRPGQSIVIRSQWRYWPARIKKLGKLTAFLLTTKIPDNPKYYRVYRTR